jgi:uncharacterized protein YecE (DUF72 family)
VFAVKGGRYLTHMKRLLDIEAPLANFFASGVLALGHKLGPILWQLPPNMAFDADRLAAFFALLPKNTRAAAALAKKHDGKLKGEAYTKPGPNRPLRYALEVRHPSFRSQEFLDLMRRCSIATVVSDSAGTWLMLEEVTADLVYIRLHGDQELYTSGYKDQALQNWARKIRRWQHGTRDTYVYFDNDAKVKAPFDALSLTEKLRARQPVE